MAPFTYEVILAWFLFHCNPKYVMCANLYEGLYELFLFGFFFFFFFWWGLYNKEGHDPFSFLNGGNIPFFCSLHTFLLSISSNRRRWLASVSINRSLFIFITIPYSYHVTVCTVLVLKWLLHIELIFTTKLGIIYLWDATARNIQRSYVIMN